MPLYPYVGVTKKAFEIQDIFLIQNYLEMIFTIAWKKNVEVETPPNDTHIDPRVRNTQITPAGCTSF